MFDNRPIGLFDSGVGGLSVLLEIKKSLPNENFVFLADQKHNPYGAKTRKQLENLSERITNFLLGKNIKTLVVACNTATCYALDHLRNSFQIPIIGVVPAVKPAAALSKKSKIAVMSTPATAKSRYLKSLIEKYAQDTQSLRLGCDGLEEAVEVLDYKKAESLLDKYVQKINDFGADVIVLGCTHFPFLKKEISEKAGDSKIIDSGSAIAARVKEILTAKNMLSGKKEADLFYTTDDCEKFSKVASTLLQCKVTAQKASI